MSLFGSPQLCNLCRFPVQPSENIRSITHVAEPPDESTNGVTSESYTPSSDRSQSFKYHQFCVDICFASLEARSLVELGQALRPALPVDDPPRGEHALRILKLSCDPQILSSNVKTPCRRQGHCKCLKCVFRQLSKLPPEVFTAIIRMAEPSNISRVLIILGETSKLLLELKNRQVRRNTLPCHGNVFQTSIEYGGKSYVTGLYDQEVPYSNKIKSEDTTCDYLVVWSDQIGITKVEFLRSKVSTPGLNVLEVTADQPSTDNYLIECRNCVLLDANHPLIIQSKREWVYTVAITETQVYLKYKGVFVERISPSFFDHYQVFWDCSKSSMLLPTDRQGEVPLARPQKDLLLRYVPLQKASAISIAFASGRIVAITSHRRDNQQTCFYHKANSDTVCMYCPLSDNEKIEAIWIIRDEDGNINIGGCSIIVQTQMKCVWLGHYIPPELQSALQIERIADNSVKALYYTDPRLPFPIVGAQPCYQSASLDHLIAPHFQAYRTPFPGFVTYSYNMFYSEAPLEGLLKIQMCTYGGYCLGMLLNYGSHSRTVGQYRYDMEISDPYEPHFIILLQEKHVSNPRVCLQILDGESAQNATKEASLRLIHGIIVWWHSKDVSVVSVIPAQ